MDKSLIIQARIFKALSDENRLRIMKLLCQREYNASELVDEMEFGQSTLSHHMKILINADIVNARKNGKWTIYSLNNEMLQTTMEWIGSYKSK